MSLTLAVILGARPQFVKAAALSRAIRLGRDVREIIIHSGQHYDLDMSDVFFEELDIPRPTLRLPLRDEDRAARFAGMLTGLTELLRQTGPDAVLVFGDTDTTLAGALAAARGGIPLAHVEAGLRSFNRAMPEESNRILTDHSSDFLFCPSQLALDNLRAEGFTPGHSGRVLPRPPQVVFSGDIQLETMRHYEALAPQRADIGPQLADFAKGREFALCTIHRDENTRSRERLAGLLEALDRAAEVLPLVLPLHPGTRRKIEGFGLALRNPRILVLPPQGFYNIVELLRRCALVLTDSGGLQKEAFFFRRPCVTLREETEWRELVDIGANVVAGTRADAVLRAMDEVRGRTVDWSAPLYGGGNTAAVILDTLESALKP